MKGTLTLISFEEDGFEILYLPSLEISSYGRTKKEAEDMLNESIVAFCNMIKDMTSAERTQEFKSLGWTKHSFYKNKLTIKSPTPSQNPDIPAKANVKEYAIAV